MPALPTYAKILLDGYSEQRESALLRTQMESGPPKQARIKSRVMIRRTLTISLLSLADYQAFVAWFKNDLGEGAAWFDMTDPISGATISARFVDGGLNAAPAGRRDVWRITATIEAWGA